ncbi:Holliday junction branch migration DNA helicase RuvB, partial [Candidatus Fermentibacterales bacterium]|nr:Holliday junction branch migration DNA helicase RuvB [Candidatus Fermentibacterales bacterium]
MRETILSGRPVDGEESVLSSLRPERLSEFIGQERILENLSIAIQAALERGEPLEHILLHGPPGLGKTTLAHVVAHEMSSDIVTSSGPSIDRAADLVGILTNLNPGDILFIDEIHRLPRVVEEYLYPAIEDFSIDFVLDPGPHARTVRLDLARFTMMGATTRAGLITGPLRDRFGMSFHFDFYTPVELSSVVTRSAGILGIEITAEASAAIACRSRGTPRIANRLLKRVRDFAQVSRSGLVDDQVAIEAMDLHGVDEEGLDTLDRKFLRVVIEQYQGGPVGISA